MSQVITPPRDNQPEGPPSMEWRIACMPHTTDMVMAPHHQLYNRTEEPRAVTCVMCKKTQVFKSALNLVDSTLRAHGRG